MAFKMKGFSGFKSEDTEKQKRRKDRLMRKKDRLVDRMDKDDEGVPLDTRKNKRLSKRHKKTIDKLYGEDPGGGGQLMYDILHKGKIYRK
tara:strand:- start:556 stop:825 length:270 start_codon:yes stop_codon:yes gene_type:complete